MLTSQLSLALLIFDLHPSGERSELKGDEPRAVGNERNADATSQLNRECFQSRTTES